MSPVFGTVSSLHPTSFLMIFILVHITLVTVRVMIAIGLEMRSIWKLCSITSIRRVVKKAKLYPLLTLTHHNNRILTCLPNGSTDVTASASRYITKPSGIPILSPVLFMHVGDPIFLLFKFKKIDLLVIVHVMISHILSQRLIIDSIEASTCTIHSFVHMNAQNMLFRLVCSWTVQLALVTVHMLGYIPLRQYYRAYTSMSSEWKAYAHVIY